MGVYELDLHDQVRRNASFSPPFLVFPPSIARVFLARQSMMNKIFNQKTPCAIVFYRANQKDKVPRLRHPPSPHPAPYRSGKVNGWGMHVQQVGRSGGESVV